MLVNKSDVDSQLFQYAAHHCSLFDDERIIGILLFHLVGMVLDDQLHVGIHILLLCGQVLVGRHAVPVVMSSQATIQSRRKH